MRVTVKFSESTEGFSAKFGEVYNITDGGYEQGYKAGYATGEAAGHKAGYSEGLAARSYETWTITLTDGSVVGKEVALL